MNSRFDDAFASILDELGGPSQLLAFIESFFGFLLRRTDFFIKAPPGSTPGSVAGLPLGLAERVVLQTFKKFESISDQANASVKSNLKSADVDESLKVPTDPAYPEMVVAEEVEVSSVDDEPTSEKEISKHEASKKEVAKKEVSKAVRPDASEIFNGADLGAYRWSQTMSELDVIIPVPNTVTKGSQVKVIVNRTQFKVSALGQVLVDGEMSNWVKDTETVWNLEPGSKILVSLEKWEERFWKKFLTNEDDIDVKKIINERPLTGSDRDAVQKLILDEEKRLNNEASSSSGSSQNSRMELEARLREAWSKDDSPFKGQPFDPSILDP